MLRRMLVPIFGAIALLLWAGPASAAPRVPNVERFEPVTIPAGQLCQFEVQLTGTNGQAERTKLPDGTTIVTGPFVLTVTNTSNQRSVTLNISGPTFASDGQLILTGPALIELFDLGPDFPPPGLLATNGRGTIDNGVFDVQNFKGRTRDLCQELSA
jgi:hypothetical protein